MASSKFNLKSQYCLVVHPYIESGVTNPPSSVTMEEGEIDCSGFTQAIVQASWNDTYAYDSYPYFQVYGDNTKLLEVGRGSIGVNSSIAYCPVNAPTWGLNIAPYSKLYIKRLGYHAAAGLPQKMYANVILV